MLYTSGSTGVPKGVLLTHGGLVNHHRVALDRYDLGPGDRVLQFCSIGFDVSIEELFPTWAAGATVVLRPEEEPILGRGWLEWLDGSRISVMNLPTAYWRQWVRGERVRWVNAYGPTEASIMATLYEPPAPGAARIERDPPIGRPVANTTVHLLDPRASRCPRGHRRGAHRGGRGRSGLPRAARADRRALRA